MIPMERIQGDRKRLVTRVVTIFLFAIWATAGSSQTPEIILENPRAVSGGALQSGATRYELAGIDAPDLLQGCRDRAQVFYRCGYDAWLDLDQIVAGRDVACRRLEAKSPGIFRAQCTIGGRDLAEMVVRRGHAVAIPGAIDYSNAELDARQSRRGFWSGSFVRPAEWRQRMRSPVFVPADGR